jgi:hypothetical protein
VVPDRRDLRSGRETERENGEGGRVRAKGGGRRVGEGLKPGRQTLDTLKTGPWPCRLV